MLGPGKFAESRAEIPMRRLWIAFDPYAEPILREFIIDRFEGEVDFDRYAAISAAIVAMGPLARTPPPAFQFVRKKNISQLVECCEMDTQPQQIGGAQHSDESQLLEREPSERQG